LVRLGEIERAEQAVADLDERDRGHGEMCIAAAVLRLAQDDPRAAMAAVAPVLDGSAPVIRSAWLVEAFLVEAIARDTLGDPGAAGRALERALDLAEPDGVLLWFLLHPEPALLQRHARHRTAHPALIADILSLLAGQAPAPPAGPPPPLEPLSDSELRVLRYLPTNLSAPQIASELHVSHNTIYPADRRRGLAVPAGLNHINDAMSPHPPRRQSGSNRQNAAPDALVAGRRPSACCRGGRPQPRW